MAEFVNAGYWLAGTDDTLPASNIDATLFTHLFVGYAQLNSDAHEVTVDPSQLILINQFSSTVKLSNPEVKTLLSIAGDTAVFAAMAAEPANRDAFIKSSIAVARDEMYRELMHTVCSHASGFSSFYDKYEYVHYDDEMTIMLDMMHDGGCTWTSGYNQLARPASPWGVPARLVAHARMCSVCREILRIPISPY
ncbi:Class V chitinase, partial [Cucurbita argyrosperma subsp. sororia]